MSGGVCKVLEYDVGLMSVYVAEMATELVLPGKKHTADFCRFINQVLTSTRLPATTILLGLNYLSKRVNTLRRLGGWKADMSQMYLMVTVALLLGSKFLDDNTFQNKSWSEVTGIDVRAINRMEAHWLRQMDWKLYVNPDVTEDYVAWLKSWNIRQESAEMNKLAERQRQRQRSRATLARERLSPLVTSMGSMALSPMGSRPISYQDAYPHVAAAPDRARLGRIKAQLPAEKPSYRSREGSSGSRYWQAAMPSPPDSGYTSPDSLWNSQQAPVSQGYDRSFDLGCDPGYGSAKPASQNIITLRSPRGHYQSMYRTGTPAPQNAIIFRSPTAQYQPVYRSATPPRQNAYTLRSPIPQYQPVYRTATPANQNAFTSRSPIPQYQPVYRPSTPACQNAHPSGSPMAQYQAVRNPPRFENQRLRRANAGCSCGDCVAGASYQASNDYFQQTGMRQQSVVG